jgi:hypothetical protein
MQGERETRLARSSWLRETLPARARHRVTVASFTSLPSTITPCPSCQRLFEKDKEKLKEISDDLSQAMDDLDDLLGRRRAFPAQPVLRRGRKTTRRQRRAVRRANKTC